MKNQLLRLAELIQENFPENLMATFVSKGKSSLAQRIAITHEAIAFHRGRSESLWLQAGKKRTTTERYAAAQAELAAFVFAYLTGNAKEYAESAIEALQTLDCQGETDLVRSLASSQSMDSPTDC